MCENGYPAHIAMFLPSLHVGGAERVTVALANAMVNRGLRVDMVLLQAEGAFLNMLHQDVRVLGLNSKRIRNGIVPLWRYMRTESPDVLYAHMYPLTSLAVLANRMAGGHSQIAVVEHTNRQRSNQLFGSGSIKFQRWLIRKTYAKADRRIAVSEDAARGLEAFAGLDPHSVKAVPNAVELSECTAEEIAEAEAIWPLGRTAPRIISVGNLKAVKNYGYLLDALARTSEQLDLQLLLIGDGAERHLLKKHAQKLGIADRVIFAGRRNNPAAFLHSADVFALSSLVEGLPTVLIEALAAGLKVVSTDCRSGPREILCPPDEPRYGALVPLDDVSAFANAILETIDGSLDSERQKKRAKAYSADKIALLYLDPFKRNSSSCSVK